MNTQQPALVAARSEATPLVQLFLICVLGLAMPATTVHGADTFAATGSLANARYGHAATLLPNGLVLVAGGEGNFGFLASAELYNPAAGTWTTTGSLATVRYYHTATLLPNEIGRAHV